jgi:hypothetical protein
VRTDIRIGEILANAISHGIGMFLGLAGAIYLIHASMRGDRWVVASCSVFAGTLVLVYLFSTLYHSLVVTRARHVFQILDHGAIYLLIAGTYTPFFESISVEGYGGWGVGWAAVWVRYGRDCRDYRPAEPGVSSDAGDAGADGVDWVGGNDCWGDDSGVLGQKIGGREALRVMAFLYLISAVGCAFAWNWDALMVARFVGGLGIGGSSVLGPVYIAELAPAKWRGRMVGLFQINIVVGILLAYLSNYIIVTQHLGARQWRWEFAVAIVPSVLFLVMLYGIPRSSRWLVTTNQTDEALEVLRLMGSPNSEAELQEIIDSVHLERGVKAEPLFTKRYNAAVVSGGDDWDVQSAVGDQCAAVLLELDFCFGGVQLELGCVADGGVGLVNLLATFWG